MRLVSLATLVVALIAPAVRANTPSPAATTAATQAPPAAPAAATPQPPAAAAPQPEASPASQPPPPEAYTYRPDGRRDPFQNLLGTGSEKNLTRKSDGPAGMTLGEISIRGIMQSKGALVAMIQGPDTKTYIVHQGDKLLDGTIKTITPQGLIVIQEVNDPLSLVKQREVRKLLRSLEDAKE